MNLIRLRTKENRLTKGKELGDVFEWSNLDNPTRSMQRFPHFTLFNYTQEYDWKEPASLQFDVTASIFDIDNVTDDQIKRLKRYFDRKHYLCYMVHTGGGVHIYAPFNTPLLGAQWKGCLPGYTLEAGRLEKRVGCKVDQQPARQIIKYGRVPGSINPKYKKVVKLIYCNDKKNFLRPIDVYGYVPQDEAILKKTVARPIPPQNNEQTRYWFEQCNYLRELKNRPDKIKHKEFLTVIRMLQNGGAHKVAREVFGPSKHSDEIESMLESTPKYVSCQNAKRVREEAVTEFKLSPLSDRPNCAGCIYYREGRGSIANITGKYPTPSSGDRYWTEYVQGKQVKYKFESLEYVKGFVNKAMYRDRDIVMALEEGKKVFYSYNGKSYTQIIQGNGGLLERLGPGGPGSLKERIIMFEKEVGVRPNLWEEIAKLFLNFPHDMPKLGFDELNKNPCYVSFYNGIYNTYAKEIIPYEKSFSLVGEVTEYNYNIEADITLAEEVFKHIFPVPDEYKLFLHFLGLTFTTLESTVVKPALWIYGPPGAGKSPIIRMLGTILGDSSYSVFTAADLDMGKKEFSVTLANRKMLFGDDLKCEKKRQMDVFRDFLTMIQSGVVVKYRKKFEKETLVRPYSTIFITSNSIPRQGDVTEGLHRRLRVVSALGIAEEREKAFFHRVVNEKDHAAIESFILLAMRGLDMAAESYKKTGDYLPPLTLFEESMVEEEKLDSQERNSGGLVDGGVTLFVEKYVIKSRKKRLTRPFIWSRYENMIHKIQGQRFGRNKFYAKLRIALRRANIDFSEFRSNGMAYFKGFDFRLDTDID